MTENQQCGTCVSFVPSKKDEKQGQCRHNPPQVIVISEPQRSPKMQNSKMIMVEGVRHKIQPMFPPMMAEDPGCQQYEAN